MKHLFLTIAAILLSYSSLTFAETNISTQPSKNISAEEAKTQLTQYYFDAARDGNTKMLSEFIQAGYNLNTQDEKGYTALILAAYHGHTEAVKIGRAHV